jgi:hypothetical protein
MDQFFKLASSGHKAAEKRKKLAEGESGWQIANEQAQQELEAAQREDSTEIFAGKIAQAIGKPLVDKDERKKAGQAVHYAFGTLMGVVYGVTTEILPEATAGGGTGFGTLLFFGADEVAVPALRLAPKPAGSAPFDHLQHWAAHVVYGGSLELIRSLIRRISKG